MADKSWPGTKDRFHSIRRLLNFGRPIPRGVISMPIEGCEVCEGHGTVFEGEEEVSCPIIHDDPRVRGCAPEEPE